MNSQNDSNSPVTGRHKCVLCEEVMSTKELLQEHFRKHANKQIETKSKKKACEIMKPKQLVEKKDINKVVKLKVKCDVCDEACDTVTQAIQHKFKQHPDAQLKHHCEFCGKQFPLVICREIHIKTEHKNQQKSKQRYKCKQCLAEFNSVEAVKFHVQSSHKRVSTIITPISTMPPSKKIKISNSGDQNSVYYCHLCGMEYMIKFNLQKHLQQNHTDLERNNRPPDIVKCSLCDAMFFNKKAYEAHNLCHTPEDLYIESEQDRKQAVTRVDCDFDLNRVPTLFDTIGKPKRPRVQRIRGTSPKRPTSPPTSLPVSQSETATTLGTSTDIPRHSNEIVINQANNDRDMNTEAGNTSSSTYVDHVYSSSNCNNSSNSSSYSSSFSSSANSNTEIDAQLKKDKMKRNRALVHSDSDCKSDTSEESDFDENGTAATAAAALTSVKSKSAGGVGTLRKNNIKKCKMSKSEPNAKIK